MGTRQARTWIVSMGGVGSKLLTRLMYPKAPLSLLEERHVHWRHLRPDTKTDKFVYVFGDPRNTVVSFFQRRETRHDGHGFAPPENVNVPMPRFVQWAMRNLESDQPIIPDDWNLKTYLENAKQDVFDLAGHVDAWLGRRKEIDITFLRYDALWQCPGEIVAHGVSLDLASIPPRRARRADWTTFSAMERAALNALYGDLATRLNQLPHVFR